MNLRPRIAWFCSFEGDERSRPRVFTQRLLPFLTEEFELFLFSAKPCEALKLLTQEGFRNVPCYHYLCASEVQLDKQFMAKVHLLEDHPSASFVKRSIQLFGGVLITFDLSLNRVTYAEYRHHSTGHDLNQLIFREFGSGAPKLGDLLVRGWNLDSFNSLFPLETGVWDAADVHIDLTEIAEVEAKKSYYKLDFPAVKRNTAKTDTAHKSPNIRLIGLNSFPLPSDLAVLARATSLALKRDLKLQIELLVLAEDLPDSEQMIERFKLPRERFKLSINDPRRCSGLESSPNSAELAVYFRSNENHGPSLSVWEAIDLNIPVLFSESPVELDLPADYVLCAEASDWDLSETIATRLIELVRNPEAFSTQAKKLSDYRSSAEQVADDLSFVFWKEKDTLHQAELRRNKTIQIEATRLIESAISASVKGLPKHTASQYKAALNSLSWPRYSQEVLRDE